MNDTMNQKEKVMGFVYVLLLFAFITTACCLLIFYYNSNYHSFSRKEHVIDKMSRIKAYQDAQNKASVMVDSLYYKIKRYDPGVQAVYEENDIRFMLNDLKKVYESHSWDARYKSFFHISEFYGMWYYDKKDLWSKNDNIVRFKKNLEECEAGLVKNKTDLNTAVKK